MANPQKSKCRRLKLNKKINKKKPKKIKHLQTLGKAAKPRELDYVNEIA
jgi:hypothetical protein